MMSENEQKDEKRDLVADIVAIVRRAAQYYEGEAEKSEGLLRESFKLSAASYREIANLVEAAWKREKAEWEAAACACVSDAVMSGRVAVEHTPVGNAAAMREALAGLIDGICFHCDLSGDCKGEPCEKMQKAKAALAAPARNCDMYDNWYDANQTWERLPKDELGYFVASNGVHECEQAWLFATAEREGGAE